MSDVLEAFKDAFIAAAPALVAALVATLIAGFTWLQKRLSLVRTEVAASALRQAQELHGTGNAAFQAASDELRKMDPKVRPKDIVQAVENAVDKDRVLRASLAPTPTAPTDNRSRPIDFPSVREERQRREVEARELDVCGLRCEHASECMMLKGHEGGHETQHGCVFYDSDEEDG